LESFHKFDLNKTWAFFCPVILKCGPTEVELEKQALIDTGAGTCHISFSLWCQLGMNLLCFNEKEELLKSQGIYSVDEMVFDRLPLKPTSPTEFWDGQKKNAFEFRLDELILGEATSNTNTISLANITVRIINSPRQEFIISMNVLRYLNINYKPSKMISLCHLSFDDNGHQLLEEHRLRGTNSMTDTFNYLS